MRWLFWNRQILRLGCRWCHGGKRERGVRQILRDAGLEAHGDGAEREE